MGARGCNSDYPHSSSISLDSSLSPSVITDMAADSSSIIGSVCRAFVLLAIASNGATRPLGSIPEAFNFSFNSIRFNCTSNSFDSLSNFFDLISSGNEALLCQLILEL